VLTTRRLDGRSALAVAVRRWKEDVRATSAAVSRCRHFRARPVGGVRRCPSCAAHGAR